MTHATLIPVADSVMSKLAELTLQLEGSQRDTLVALITAGLGGTDGDGRGQCPRDLLLVEGDMRSSRRRAVRAARDDVRRRAAGRRRRRGQRR